MILAGKFQNNPAPDDYSLLHFGFDRLPRDVAFLGKYARMVGFETLSHPGAHMRFLGVEVESLEQVPEGLVAWDLGADAWTAWQMGDASREILWQEPLQWIWREPSRNDPSRWLGEFTAQGGRDLPSGQTFTLFTHVYVDPQKTGFQDEIHLEAPDRDWPVQFDTMARWLQERLGEDVAIRVEHYGSTAIPDLPAKPVIDILVQVPSFEEAKKRALPALGEETWEFWWYGEHMVFFKRKEIMGERTHHIHMAPKGHGLWKGIAFRDFLRDHPEDAVRYAALKTRLVESLRDDREGYTQAKTRFVQEINQKALEQGYGAGF